MIVSPSEPINAFSAVKAAFQGGVRTEDWPGEQIEFYKNSDH